MVGNGEAEEYFGRYIKKKIIILNIVKYCYIIMENTYTADN